jgi:hypothetical protein
LTRISGDDLRQQLYAGNLVILTRLQALRDFVEYTRDELTVLFKPHDPEYVHEHVDPPEMAKILGSWKPRFIHSERSKKLVRAVVEEAGFTDMTTILPVSSASKQPGALLPHPRTQYT